MLMRTGHGEAIGETPFRGDQGKEQRRKELEQMIEFLAMEGLPGGEALRKELRELDAPDAQQGNSAESARRSP